MKIGEKVNLILIIVFISGIFVSGGALSQLLERKAENEITANALIAMEMANAVRKYTDTRVNPLLAPKLETEAQFIPEAIPTFSTREVFEILRKNKKFQNFAYKDATLNPINVRDKADAFETSLVEKFIKDRNLTTLSGFREMSGENMFYSARPFVIQENRCLRCHSDPEKAPKSQIATYGRDNGYRWKLNDVVAAQMVYVPAQQVFNNAKNSLVIVILILLAIFSLIVFLMNTLLKKAVLQRIKIIANVASEVSIGNMEADFGKQPKDEIGALAESFNRMKHSLEIALNLLNQRKNTGND